jgi:hypothetical protein
MPWMPGELSERIELLFDVEEIGLQPRPDLGQRIDLRLLDRKIDREMLFQGDFVLQLVTPQKRRGGKTNSFASPGVGARGWLPQE